MASVSISTMWSVKYAKMAGFLKDVREFGFTHLELSSALKPDTLNSLLQAEDLKVSSVHAPCPNWDTPEGLAVTLSLSSLAEGQRRLAVENVKQTVDLAVQVRAPAVVVHAGYAEMDPEMERNLRKLWTQNGANRMESDELRSRMGQIRKLVSSPHVDAARESLLEIAAYARPKGIRIALENRAHFHEIPNIDEMMDILSEFDPQAMGYWHDIGHAEMQSRLGFTPHEDWFAALGHRLIGVHLHDVRGLHDHHAPGIGEMKWDMIAQNLSEDVIRVCEVAEWNEPAHARQTAAFLREKGII